MILLPPIPGPKIGQFLTKGSGQITFLELLGFGTDAEVYKVKIDGHNYSLKVVCYLEGPLRRTVDRTNSARAQFDFDSGYRRFPCFNLPHGEPEWTESDALYNFHPFFSECRAYGRLKEVGKERLSVRCHGYLLLESVQRSDLEKFRSNFPCFDNEPFDHSGEYKNQPIRALVKDYIESTASFLPRMIPRMMRDIHEYHKCGISLGDIKENNYLDGILFDLSRARTVPHPELTTHFIDQAFKAGEICEIPVSDYDDFDCMVDEWNDDHPNQIIWHRFLPNLDYADKLRGVDVSRHRLNNKEYIERIRRRHRIVYHRPELYQWKRGKY